MRRFLFAVLTCGILGGVAFAHSGATGIVKERMSAMKQLGGLMKQLVKMNWSNAETAQTQISGVADQIVGHAQSMPKMFPKDSNKHPSEALEAIWLNEVEFSDAIVALENAALALKTAGPTLGSADDMKPLIRGLGQACSACHREFRKKK